jgi:aminoglycoside 6'-N-acetyltransferase
MDDRRGGTGHVRLRPATVADVETLVRWDSDPDVDASGGDDDEFDWATEVPRSVGWREILVAEEDGRPVGVTVLIDAAREETHYWGDRVDPGAWAIDIWIGDAGDRNRGIGTLMMREAVERCFGAHGATSVLIDPLESNVGAIRFYERFGFVHEGPRRFGDDDCLVMRFARRP